MKVGWTLPADPEAAFTPAGVYLGGLRVGTEAESMVAGGVAL